MKTAYKIIFVLTIIFNMCSCISVDVARSVITPSIDGILRNHGYTFSETQIPLIPRPNRTTVEQKRLITKDGLVNIAVTHMLVAEQKIGFVHCGGNGFRQNVYANKIFNAFYPSPNILLFDYPGYGLSGGETTFNQFNLATQMLTNHIEEWRKENNFEKIIFWGKSFGGTLCARMAGRYNGDSVLVLETTYNDLYSLLNSYTGILKALIKFKVDPDTADFHINQSLANYTKPIVILKSINDPIVPPQSSDSLARVLRKQGNNVLLLSMGKARHSDFLFFPCLAEPAFKKIKPLIGNLNLNMRECIKANTDPTEIKATIAAD